MTNPILAFVFRGNRTDTIDTIDKPLAKLFKKIQEDTKDQYQE